jgi:hypothetical protein
MRKKWKMLLVLPAVAVVAMLVFLSSGCGGGGSCDGLTFVNASGESVIVSASATSGIAFGTFTLSTGESNQVCGNDTDGISGVYTWPNADTYEKGSTNSSANVFMCLLPSHTASMENTEDDC